MTDKQQKMWAWLIERVMFAMDQGDLTEQHCLDAVIEANNKLDAVNLEREFHK